MKKFIALLALGAAAAPSFANDSSAAIGLGGLELTRNAAISMDSEDLFLSRQLVTVKYRFTNTSTKDVETLVSFPLPAIPAGIDGHMGDQGFPDWPADLDFKTLVDGQPVQLEVRNVVSIIGDKNGQDISATLGKLGWPVRYWTDYAFEQRLQDLPEAEKVSGIANGLLRREEGAKYVLPNWQVTTHVTRTQNFPAGKTVTVEHSYKPVSGGSVGGTLMKQYRKEYPEYLQRYCVDDSFLKGFDRRIAAQDRAAKARGEEGGYGMFVEHWLDYVLKSGANWKGPIKDFRLVVDKGKPDNLLSFCMDGVKKISSTRFEVRKSNFEPTRDIEILIAEFYDQNAL